ncbi:MAG: hypothetical protein J6Y02_03350 [Pseudobutyrivibrio sp.]|nr:hypothetical protein [Pseudobutyrivibrio sp.]
MWKPTTSSDALYHSAKGTHWGKHKYIAIKNGRYIYPDTATGDSKAVSRRLQAGNKPDGGPNDKTDAYKKSQKAASEHAPKFEDVKEKRFDGSTADAYKYVYRDSNDGKKSVSMFRSNPGRVLSNMRGDIEKEDYFAAAASKNSARNRAEAARKHKEEKQSFSKMLDDDPKRKGEVLREAKKWETAEKSAKTRQKQKEEYASKKKQMKDASQSAGHKRTNYEKAKADNKYLTRSQNYGDRLEGQRRIANAKGEYETARKLDKKVKIADSVYIQGANAEYSKNHSGAKRKGKKVTNKTARKNQRRAKIESAAFKAKRISKKAVSKGKSLFSKYIKKR